MILRAKQVLPMSAPPIDDGAVVVEGDAIVAVGPTKDIRAAHAGDVRDLGEVVLLPGLINAHCHLEYTNFVNQVEWRGSFLEWVLQLVALKSLKADKDYVAAIQKGLAQLARTGTTTVVNVESFPALIDALPPAPIRVWWCLELIDFNRRETPTEIVEQAMKFLEAHTNGLGRFGLSPHAPYTASDELYRQCGRIARERGLLLTTHLAESEEEDDMFHRGTGPMYDYFRRADRDMSDCKHSSVVQLLNERGVLGPHCLAAHCNCLTPIDVNLLCKSGTHIVHCPKSHRFFQRTEPLFNAFHQQSINVCLGTDSLASNDTLDMFAEMKALSLAFPRWTAEQILAMATTNAAKALNLSGKLGQIAPGAWADLIAVPLSGPVIDLYESVVYADKPVNFFMIGGKEIVL